MKFAYSLAASLASFFLILTITAGFLAMSNDHDRQYLARFLPQNRPTEVPYTPPVRATPSVVPPTQQTIQSSLPLQQYTPPVSPAKPPSSRPAIETLLTRWKTSWESHQLDDFLSCYYPTARVFKNKKWYDFNQFRSDEATRFAKGGHISIETSIRSFAETPQAATLVFSDSFSRTGGGPDFHSDSVETWKLTKDTNDRWLIVEDRSDPTH